MEPKKKKEEKKYQRNDVLKYWVSLKTANSKVMHLKNSLANIKYFETVYRLAKFYKFKNYLC